MQVAAVTVWTFPPGSAADVRGWVLDALGTIVGRAPADLGLERSCEHCAHPTHGRPRFADGDSPRFSVSHSADRAVLAVANTPVGVDVEVVRPRARLDRLAARTMAAAELHEWQLLPAEARLRAFLRSWTTKEAYAKALGRGVFGDVRAIPTAPEGWTVHALDLAPDVVGTVVTRGAATVDVRPWPAPAGSLA